MIFSWWGGGNFFSLSVGQILTFPRAKLLKIEILPRDNKNYVVILMKLACTGTVSFDAYLALIFSNVYDLKYVGINPMQNDLKCRVF